MTRNVLNFIAGTSLLLGAGCLSVPAGVAPNDVDWGDDSSIWSSDGNCDDPRFEGAGMHSLARAADVRKDATDCRALFEAGQVTLRADYQPGQSYSS